MPGLVIAPSFLPAMFFIYGLMAWNGYLSLSASRLCDRAARHLHVHDGLSRGQISLGAASATIMLATVAAIVVPYLYSEPRAKR